jgi:hypothetical protein
MDDAAIKTEECLTAFMLEIERAKKIHPDWPLDVVHAAAILCEEAGELIQAALDFHYGRGNILHNQKGVGGSGFTGK